MMGSTVNTMILGGLALAFSRIIDNSVISLENIYRHLELGASPRVAAEQGGNEVSLAVLAATLTTVVVFFPVTLLYGVSKFLFSALALAVVISLFASYFVAMTVIPLFCSKYLKRRTPRRRPRSRRGFNAWFNRSFNRFVERLTKRRCGARSASRSHGRRADSALRRLASASIRCLAWRSFPGPMPDSSLST